MLLERLSPIERAVFLLREAFDYEYGDISRIVGRSEANCRTVPADISRSPDTASRSHPAKRDHTADRFFAACVDGDLEALEQLLAEDVVFYPDGGASRPRCPIRFAAEFRWHGSQLVRHAAAHRWRFERALVNACPGARVLDDHCNVVAVLAVQVADGQVESLYNVVNPDKLHHLGRQIG